MNINIEKLKNAVLVSLDHKKNITREIISKNVETLVSAFSSMLNYNYSDEELLYIKRVIESVVPHTMKYGQTIKDQSHRSWLYNKKENIELEISTNHMSLSYKNTAIFSRIIKSLSYLVWGDA